MAHYELISAAQTHKDIESNDALLVCAYKSEEKFKQACPERAISLQEFKQKEDELETDREIIFYCS